MRMLLIYVSTFTIFMLAAWGVDRAFRTETTMNKFNQVLAVIALFTVIGVALAAIRANSRRMKAIRDSYCKTIEEPKP